MLFNGGVLWRGFVYALLMAFAKFMTGIWIILLPAASSDVTQHEPSTASYPQIIEVPLTPIQRITVPTGTVPIEGPTMPVSAHDSRLPSDFSGTSTLIVVEEKKVGCPSPSLAGTASESLPSKLQSRLYPALLLALAMTTRGEIGFLIAAVAQSSGLLVPEDVYLIVQWGIVLCTLCGPIGVGLVVRKIKQGRAYLAGWGDAEFV
jgi:hypothetical protein